MMVIFFDQIDKIILPVRQVLQANKLGQIFFLGPHLLQKVENMQNLVDFLILSIL